MITYFKLAWRNIWRNKRRTLITTASILFAIFFALIMRAMQLGTYDSMIDNVVTAYTGYIQVHKKGYEDNKTINMVFDSSDELEETLLARENVERVVHRLESFALGAHKDKTKGVMVVGTSPAQENRMTHLREKLTSGKYLQKGSSGVLIGSRLANYLQLETGDTLTMLGQGYHGMSAAGKYPVRGILDIPSPDLDNKIVYMPLAAAQDFYSAYGKLTTLSLDLKDNDALESTLASIRRELPADQYEVLSWREILTELVQQIQSDNASGMIMLFLLYIIIAFGVFGTVLMMIAERRKEFGVMISVGMKRFKLMLIVMFELLIIGILGMISGTLLSMPVILYYHLNPIRFTGEYAEVFTQFGIEPVMPFAWQPDFFINQGIIVFCIILLTFIYPLTSIGRLNPIQALRS